MLPSIGQTSRPVFNSPAIKPVVPSQESCGWRRRADRLRYTGFGKLAGAGLMLAAGCATPPAEPVITDATRVRLAQALEAEGDPTSAANILNGRTVQPRPDRADALRQARLLLDVGQVDQGFALARAAMLANAGNPRIAIEVARMAVRAGRLAEAEGIYRQLIERFPNDADAFVGSGALRAQAGDFPAAIQQFYHALALKPADVAARNNLALALAMNGQSAEAVPMLEQLSQEAGMPPLVQGNLALAQGGGWRGPGAYRTDPLARVAGVVPPSVSAPIALHSAVPGCSPSLPRAPAAAQPTIAAAPLPAPGMPQSAAAEACVRKVAPRPAPVPLSAAPPLQPISAEAAVLSTALAAPAPSASAIVDAVPLAADAPSLAVAAAWARKAVLNPASTDAVQGPAVVNPQSALALASPLAMASTSIKISESALVAAGVLPEPVAAVWARRIAASSVESVPAADLKSCRKRSLKRSGCS